MKTDGISVYKSIEGKAMPDTPRFMYWEFHERGFKQAVRYGKWKADVIGGKMELYDLASDISEEHNVIEQYPEVAQKIQNYLDTCRTASPYWPTDID